MSEVLSALGWTAFLVWVSWNDHDWPLDVLRAVLDIARTLV